MWARAGLAVVQTANEPPLSRPLEMMDSLAAYVEDVEDEKRRATKMHI